MMKTLRVFGSMLVQSRSLSGRQLNLSTSKLPKERLIVALDAKHGEVVVDGWQTKTGHSIVERMQALREYVSGFLVTFVENEGRMKGTQMARVAELVDACGDAKLTIAGGVTTPSEIAELDAMGVDAQVGMAFI